jgi:DNA polymerase III subunit delta
MTKSTPTFYVFHGDDDFRIEEEVRRIRDRMAESPNGDLNTSEFDGPTVNVSEVVAAATAYPFLADRRLIVVKDLLSWITRKGAGETGKKAVAMLESELPHLPDWTRLVFVEREKLSDSNKILKLAQSTPSGFEKLFTAAKDSTSWIIKRAEETYGAKIEPRAAAALSSVTQGDLRLADNELLKLVSYADGARTITEPDVALLTPYVAEASMFEMVDALAEGRGQTALRLIHRLLEQQEDVFSLYGMIVRQFRLLLLAKEHLTTGGTPADLADTLRIHRFVAQKVAQQTRSFSLEQLERIYHALLDYDVKIKTGRIEPELALDLLITGLTR